MLQVDLLGTTGVAESLTSSRGSSVERGGFEESLSRARERSSRFDAESDRASERAERDQGPDSDDAASRAGDRESKSATDRARPGGDEPAGEPGSAPTSEALAGGLVIPIDLAANTLNASDVTQSEGVAASGAPAVEVGTVPSTPATPGSSVEAMSDEANAVKQLLPNEGGKGLVAESAEGRVVAKGAVTDDAEPVPTSVPRANAAPKADGGDQPVGALEAAKQFAALRSEKPAGEEQGASSRVHLAASEVKPRPEAGMTPATEAPTDRSQGTNPSQPVSTATAATTPANDLPPTTPNATADAPDPGSVEATSKPTNAPSELGSTPREGATRVEVLRTQQASEAEIAELPPRILRLVRQALRRREGGIKIQLDPPHLGRVDVEFKVGKGRFGVRMEVDSQEVKDALLQDLDHLRESLAAFQTEAGTLEVEVRDREPSDGSDSTRSGAPANGEAGDGSEVEREVSIATPEHLGRQIDRKG